MVNDHTLLYHLSTFENTKLLFPISYHLWQQIYRALQWGEHTNRSGKTGLAPDSGKKIQAHFIHK